MNFKTTIETKLLIIPAKDIDEFEIMEKEEEISEMVVLINFLNLKLKRVLQVSAVSSKCLQHVVQSRMSRLKKRKKRQTLFNMSGRRVKYGDSRISSSRSIYNTRSGTTNISNHSQLVNDFVSPLNYKKLILNSQASETKQK